MRNIYREALRAKPQAVRWTPTAPKQCAVCHPPAQTPQPEGTEKWQQTRKRVRQFYIAIATLLQMAGLEYAPGMPDIRDKATGYVYTPVDCQPNYKG